MADLTNADARRGLTVEPPPHHAPTKDVQGPDNPIPLSPQWLISKVVDSKELGPNHENKPDALKASGDAEDPFSTGKRKDIFRPILDDSAGRRDRWHDEERETNSAIRRDRWREGDKEPGDTRRIERWTENTHRHASEARRAPPERWNDSGNKEIDQRRESKWNTRWGPGDKESDSRREKWIDSGKGGIITLEKGASYFAIHGKDTNNYGKDTEGDDHYSRSWRSNYALGRGRGDSSHYSSQTPTKTPNVYGYSKGRSENDISPGSIGRGRFNSSMSSPHSDASRFHHLGYLHEKSDDACGDLSTLRYTRMKMLDIYRRTDLNRIRSSIDEFVEVPALTQYEPLEPLAFSAPSTDESVIIKGIDKGDIVSSGAPQLSKESSVGRNNQDASSSRLVKLGGKSDLPASGDAYRDESIDNTKADSFGPLESTGYEKQYYQLGQYTTMDTNLNSSSFHSSKLNVKELGVIRPNADETARFENSSHYVPRRSQLTGDNKHGSFLDRKDFPEDQPDTRLSLLQKEMESNHKMTVSSSFLRDEVHWQNTEGIGFRSDSQNESYISRQSTDVLKEGDPFISKDVLIARRPQSPSPEDLSLYYKDPQGQIQGPFSGSDLIQWFDAGYFGIDLQVRLANSAADAPFFSLGDVMPHLKLKAKPPPGFGVAKQSATLDDSLREKFVNPSSIHTGLGEHDILLSGQRNMNDVLTEKQNRYLESLMFNSISGSTSENFSFTRGMQEFGGSSGRLPSIVSDSGNDANYLLTQARLLERQRSSLNPLSYWSSGDVSSIASKTDIVSDSSVPHPKLFPSSVDPSIQSLQPLQQVDLLSLLHAGADKPPRPASSGVTFHSNFLDTANLHNPNHGGPEFPSEALNMHHNQHMASQIRFGAQQPCLQPTNQAPSPHLITQPPDLSSCIVPPDKLISSEMNQDPRLPSLLQQQYLLSQLQLQAQVPAAQLPLLEKILLLQQQQKQEQQQLLLQQQQQHMLSKVLSGRSQQFVDPSYGQAPAAMPAGHAAVDNLLLQRVHEQFQINQQMPAAFERTEQPSYYSNLNLAGTLNVSSVSSSVPSLHLPHPIIDKATLSNESERQVKLHNDGIINPVIENSINFPEVTEKPGKVIVDQQKISESLDDVETGHKPPSICQTKELPPLGSEAYICVESVEESQMAEDILSSNLDQAHDVTVTSVNLIDQNLADLTISKEVVEEPQEVKKASEKKSKKQKKSKAKLVLDTGKRLPKVVSSQKTNAEIGNVGSNINEGKSEVRTNTEVSLSGASIGPEGELPFASSVEPYDSLRLQKPLPENMQTVGLIGEGDAEPGVVGTTAPNPKTTSTLGAWKSAPGLKPKSLLEIQQEEQLRAQSESARSEVAAPITSARNQSPAHWSGIVINFENKLNGDTVLEPSSTLLVDSEDILKSKGKKSQLHDLLAEEVLAKSKEDTDSSANNAQSSIAAPPLAVGNVDAPFDSDDFVEAKDTRKARKKASKSKAPGVKIPQPVVSAEISTSPSPIEKVKSARQAQQEKESLPTPPGPSLGDFVVWKGDQASSVPPAWSMDSRKAQRPMSLRDIQSEQEKRSGTMQQQVPIPTPPKVQSNLASRGGGASWQVPASSPSKTSSIQFASSVSSQTKSKVEDDLFWGPPEQSKSEYRKSDFPLTENSTNWGIKGSVPKGTSGARAGHKPTGSRAVDYSLPSSPGSSLSVSKGRSISGSKNSEATEFREWCMNQWFRLTGTDDTSFLEFCIKQSTTEAEMLLRENLGPLDPNHEFTEKFLNYKEFLSADVLEIAFQSWKSINTSSAENTNHQNPNTAAAAIDADEGAEDGAKGRGKKRGKKGQKVNPSILGFSVTSNRIMRGEIQSVEE